MLSPSIDAFTMGNCCSAMIAARTKNGMKVSRAPCRCSKADFVLLRRWTIFVMSTSNMAWTWALVRRDSIMRCAMICRIFVMGTDSAGIAAGAGGAEVRAAAGALAVVGADADH